MASESDTFGPYIHQNKNNMKKLIVCISVTSLFLCSCQKEKNAPSNPANPVVQISGARVISEIHIGSSTIVFMANGTTLGILTKKLPGEQEILTAEMAGLTLAEIHRRLAPEKVVPAELLACKERFETRADNSAPVPAEGAFRQPSSTQETGKSSNPASTDLNDAWFSSIYCNPPSFWNGYNACLLNRTPERGLSTDWAWANATRSTVYVYPYQGHQIHLNGKVDGNSLFDVDLLSGYVYSYWMFSGTSFWGCRQMKQHFYTITNTYGSGWHWSLRSNTDC
jgi:hypothetical protein